MTVGVKLGGTTSPASVFDLQRATRSTSPTVSAVEPSGSRHKRNLSAPTILDLFTSSNEWTSSSLLPPSCQTYALNRTSTLDFASQLRRKLDFGESSPCQDWRQDQIICAAVQARRSRASRPSRLAISARIEPLPSSLVLATTLRKRLAIHEANCNWREDEKVALAVLQARGKRAASCLGPGRR